MLNRHVFQLNHLQKLPQSIMAANAGIKRLRNPVNCDQAKLRPINPLDMHPNTVAGIEHAYRQHPYDAKGTLL